MTPTPEREAEGEDEEDEEEAGAEEVSLMSRMPERVSWEETGDVRWLLEATVKLYVTGSSQLSASEVIKGGVNNQGGGRTTLPKRETDHVRLLQLDRAR